MKRLMPSRITSNGNRTWKHTIRPIFIWVALVYFELLLILGGRSSASPASLLYIALFGACAAAAIDLLSTIWANERVSFAILTVIMAVITVFFGVKYFCKAFFTHYMSLGSLLAGTKGVLKEFFDVMVHLVLHGFWMVLLLLVPLAALIVLGHFHIISFASTGKRRIAAVAIAILFFLAGGLLINGNHTAKARYGANYEFDIAAKTFGSGTSTRLNIQYLIFGNPSSGDFSYVDHDIRGSEDDSVFPLEMPPEENPDIPEPITYGCNALDIDFAALSESAEDPTVAATHVYVASLTPSQKNQYTGLFAGKKSSLSPPRPSAKRSSTPSSPPPSTGCTPRESSSPTTISLSGAAAPPPASSPI